MIKTKGGYAMVDLAHVSLSGLGVTFAGLYQKLYSKLGKPILLCNVNIGGTEYQDCYVQPVYTAEGFEMTVGDYTITVSSDSVVTATEGIVGGGASGASALSELTDVDIDDPTDGQVLMRDGDGWKNAKVTFDTDIYGVNIDNENIQDGDVLKYDENSGKWVNGEASGGDGVPLFGSLGFNMSGTYPTTTGTKATVTSISVPTGTMNNLKTIMRAMQADEPDYLLCVTPYVTFTNEGQTYSWSLILGSVIVDAHRDGTNRVSLRFRGMAQSEYTPSGDAPQYAPMMVNANIIINVETWTVYSSGTSVTFTHL